MANRKVKAKKMKVSNDLKKNKIKLILIFSGSAVSVALLVLLILFLSRPRLLWYVDEDISADWNRILRESQVPFERYEIISRSDNEPFPQGRFGFIISRRGPEGERIEGTPIELYPNLSRTRVYNDWFVLAVDPWMVFRKHRDPVPPRSFLDNTNQRGSLLLAGNDKASKLAWLSQLLQNNPRSFTAGAELWDEKEFTLTVDYPFQSGASQYSWIQVWPLVFRSETVYLYAPLSQARRQRPEQMGLLGASRFPEPPNWGSYGLQADILWAGIQGNEKQREMLEETLEWLANPQVQTLIANTFQWIPAHPSGAPYNSFSSDSQMAWLRSSYIWQGAY